ncbi:MAG: ABC-type transport system [Microbacterium sp.]|nr:ABC-type transport system [Microbacterium sp.]
MAAPFLVVATAAGGLNPGVILASLGILVLEVGIVAAIGVGFSAVVARPIFSVASTYLVIAALSIGTLIAFGLGGLAVRSEQVSISRDFDWNALPEGCAPGTLDGSSDCPTYDELPCIENRYTTEVPRFDRVWWVLAANPFVILADATPPTYVDGYPRDLFSQIAFSVRVAQKSPETETRFDGCVAPDASWSSETPEEQLDGTVPSWFVGLLVQDADRVSGLPVQGDGLAGRCREGNDPFSSTPERCSPTYASPRRCASPRGERSPRQRG